METFPVDSLDRRLQLIVDRLGFVPKRDFLMQVPYWSAVVEQVECVRKTGIAEVFDTLIPKDYFAEQQVPLPSLEQCLTGATIAVHQKNLLLSKPGTQKTIASLSAVVPIEEECLPVLNPGQKGVKTVITCPGYIIPTWTRGIEQLFDDPHIAVVTRMDRERAIARAADPETNFVIIGYDLTFRKLRNGKQDFSPSARFRELYAYSLDDMYNHFRSLLLHGSRDPSLIARVDTRVANLRKKDPDIHTLLDKVIKFEDRLRQQEDAQQVIAALRDQALNHGLLYYAIVDEYHNIVGPDRKRALAIADLVKHARWRTLVSGTGIGNTADQLGYGAYLLDFVDDPLDFRRFIRKGDTLQKIRTFIDLYAVKPIRTLADIDPLVKDPIVQEVSYNASLPEIDMFIALMSADNFSGLEKYRLFQYLIANPHKLLPDRFEHLDSGDDPFIDRLENFFLNNPGLEDRLRAAPRSRMDAVYALVAQMKVRGEKCLVACEYQREVTDTLEGVLKEFGVCRVDQSVSAELKPVRLSAEELATLRRAEIAGELRLRGDVKYRSDLSAAAKNYLHILPHEVYWLSDRDKVLHTAATNPDVTALVTTRVLREGVELREFTNIINYEDTTVPSRFEQFNSRSIRSGQHAQTYLWDVVCPQLLPVLNAIRNTRVSKQRVNDAGLSDVGPRPSAHDLEEWVDSVNPKRPDEIRGIFEQLNNRSLLSLMFNALEGAGAVLFSEVMRRDQNALLLARLYNHEWELTYAGNVARLNRDVILGLEQLSKTSFVNILDAGAGPCAVSRILCRPSVAVDMNRFQLEHGLDACRDIPVTCYVGDITDLKAVVPFADRVQVFEPGKQYEHQLSLGDGSFDLVVSSLNLDLLDQQGRYAFLREAARVLAPGKYAMVTLPAKKVDPASRPALLKDVEACGFKVIDYLTGTYQGRCVEKDKNAERVEAYIVVAQRDDSKYQQVPPRLALHPEVRIVESAATAKHLLEKRVRHTPLVDAEYFVKLEDGRRADAPVPQEVVQLYDQEIREIVRTVPSGTLEKTLDDISRTLLGDDHGN